MIDKRPDQSQYGPAATGRYAVLTMGNLGLLIPQHQVHALEPGLDVQRSETDDVGWISIAGNRSPVYCLSEDLKPMHEVPAGRSICVLLETGSGLFGALCDQVTMLQQTSLEILPLPDCMRTLETPLQGLAMHDERVLCVTSAQNLSACVGKEQRPILNPPPIELLAGRVS